VKYGPNVNPVGGSKPFPRSGLEPSVETVVVTPVRFPTEGKASNLGGVLGRAPFTPRPLLESAIASEAVGRFVLRHGTLVNPDIGWKKLNVERPTIVMSLTTDTPGEVLLNVDGPRIIYNYGKIPDSIDQAQRSSNVGTCFLSNAGAWYLRHDPPDLEDTYPEIDCLLIDASNPEVARRFLEQPGVNFAFEENFNLTEAAATAIPFGRYARAVTVQNVPPSGSAGGEVRYCIGQPALYLNNGAWTGVGFRLLLNGSVTFSGKALTTFGIYACSETAGVATAVEVVRYMD
jgi:hypothetical protein